MIQMLFQSFNRNIKQIIKVIGKQWTGTGAIKGQIPLLKPKREINKYYKLDIIQWEQIANRAGSYFQKGGHSATQIELKV